MIRVLSALLLGVLLISSCSESSENGERLMPREVEVKLGKPELGELDMGEPEHHRPRSAADARNG